MKRLILAMMLCARGVQAEEALDYAGFHSVELRNGIIAEVSVGDTAVTIDDSDGAIENLVTNQFGEWLRIDRNTRWLIFTNGRQDQFVASLQMPEVRELKALSGAVITADLGMQDQFRAEAEDGEIVVSVETPRLRLRANDGAAITVTGVCERLTMLARPTSTVDLSGLSCESIVIFGDKSRVVLPEGANVVDQHADT